MPIFVNLLGSLTAVIILSVKLFLMSSKPPTSFHHTFLACETICLSTNINEETVKFKIYPNPAKSTLTISGAYTSISIHDVVGKVVLTSDYKNVIDVGTLSNGIFFMHIFVDSDIAIKRITIAK